MKTIKMILGLLMILQGALFVSNMNLAEAQQSNSGALTTQRVVRAGDVLTITVWKNKDLSKTVIVNDNGTIDYFFLGEIVVAGKTIDQIESIIYKGVHENYIVDPKIDIELDEASLTFFITGEVNKPGTYQFKPGLNILTAIAIAGGFSDFASRKVVIIRKDESGKEYEIKVNTKKLLKANNVRDDYTIEYDDIVVAKRSWF